MESHRLVHPVRIDARGEEGPTRGQAAGPRWRQSTHGLYVPADVDPSSPRQRVAEQAARLGPAGAVTGWAALLLLGGDFFDGLERDGRTRRPVPLVDPGRHLRPSVESAPRRDRLAEDERTRRHGIRCTTPERALFDEMRGLPLRDAVVACDMAAHAELTSIARMTAFLAAHRGWDGSPVVDSALLLASEHSRSRPETDMRLVWEVDAGFGRPLCNRPVFSRGGLLLGVPDLLDPRLGVVGEYDGADHREDDRRFRDLGREQAFRDHGLECFTLVGGDLRDRERAVARMRATRDRALATEWLRPDDWTLEPPPGWHHFHDEIPLDHRLDARDLARLDRETG